MEKQRRQCQKLAKLIIRESLRCRARNAVNCLERRKRLLSALTIFQFPQDGTPEQDTTSIFELFLEAYLYHPLKALPYKNFRLRDWYIETDHYEGFPQEDAGLFNQLFWSLYGQNIRILTLSHCQIPFNFTLLPRVLWRVVPNLESLTLSNCVMMEMNTKSENLFGMLRGLRRDSWDLTTYPAKLTVLFLQNVTCILDARFPIEWSGVVSMLSNLDAICVHQRDFGAAMNFFNFLKLMPNETIWKRPTPKPFMLRWTGIMNWPRWEGNGLPSNHRNWLSKVELCNDRLIAHFSRSSFQGLKNLAWKSCLCRVLGRTEGCEVDEPSLTNCRHVLIEKTFWDGGETVDIFIRVINTGL